jgi:RAT1-interacting protein
MVRRGTGCWDGNVCINFAAAFLQHLKQTITDEGVYKISLRKKGGVVEVHKMQEKGTGGILCKEFLEWRSKGQDMNSHKKEDVGVDEDDTRLQDTIDHE